jgi:hypothetical protein
MSTLPLPTLVGMVSPPLPQAITDPPPSSLSQPEVDLLP